jgi:hypothetical protein
MRVFSVRSDAETGFKKVILIVKTAFMHHADSVQTHTSFVRMY